MSRIGLIASALILTLSLTACASAALKFKQTLVAGDTSVTAGLVAAQDSEIALYQSRVDAALTPAVHIKLQNDFKATAAELVTAGTDLEKWDGTIPVPTSLAQAKTLLTTLRDELNTLGAGGVASDVQKLLDKLPF
jgi:hypothetical protein